jgi:DNA repair exonuclease SbcCD ATPase subunit
MTDSSDKCAICLEDLSSQQTYTLQCGHCFHTKCQIIWFRNGHSTCPTCRNSHNDDSLPRRLRINQTAFQIMSHRARKKDAPIPLKRAYEKYKEKNNQLKIIKNELKELKNSVGKYSDIQKNITLLQTKYRKTFWAIRRLHREISELCEIVTVFSS